MSGASQFQSALIDRLPQLLYELLGKPAAKTGTEWRYRRKGSLSVRVDGAKAGQWFDHEAGHGGGFVALVAHELGCDQESARDWVAERTGVRPTGSGTPKAVPRPRLKAPEPSREELAAKARVEAQQVLAEASPAPAGHPYLVTKGIQPHGILIDPFCSARGLDPRYTASAGLRRLGDRCQHP